MPELKFKTFFIGNQDEEKLFFDLTGLKLNSIPALQKGLTINAKNGYAIMVVIDFSIRKGFVEVAFSGII